MTDNGWWLKDGQRTMITRWSRCRLQDGQWIMIKRGPTDDDYKTDNGQWLQDGQDVDYKTDNE